MEGNTEPFLDSQAGPPTTQAQYRKTLVEIQLALMSRNQLLTTMFESLQEMSLRQVRVDLKLETIQQVQRGFTNPLITPRMGISTGSPSQPRYYPSAGVINCPSTKYPSRSRYYPSTGVINYPETPGTRRDFPSDTISSDQGAEDVEMPSQWILNQSMRFRHQCDWEKFFFTYTETPSRWHRVTISCDYSNAVKDTLEYELSKLQFERSKGEYLWEVVRESLPDIHLYTSVTNLKAVTVDGRLHLCVTEDVNEIIDYPSVNVVSGLEEVYLVPEDDLAIDHHLSGYEYTVKQNGQVFVRKDISGPNMVDEFIYEIYALHALRHSPRIVNLVSIVTDASRQIVKGFLTDFAEQGPLCDILHDLKGMIPWARREQWAVHLIEGLAEIHACGFIHGQFTLSNIVLDRSNNIAITGINPRGCPAGWEAREIASLRDRLIPPALYVGPKSDLFQLGMVLWVLAEDHDEPETVGRPLVLTRLDIPRYYADMVSICLSDDPRNRQPADVLLSRCPRL
jgi:hypothetical protein